MRTFGIFSLVAALAATLSVSAAPTPAGDLTSVNARDAVIPGGISSGSLLSRSEFEASPLDVVEREAEPLPPTADRPNRGSFVAIIVDATAKIQLLGPPLDKHVKDHADVRAFVDILHQIRDIVVGAVVDIEGLVKANVSLVIFLEHKAVAEVVGLVNAFIRAIVTVCLKIALVVALDVEAIAAVIADICVSIVRMLQLCLQMSLELVFGICFGLITLPHIDVLHPVYQFALGHH